VRFDVVRPQYAFSDSGALVYVPGTGPAAATNRVLTWVDRNGAREPLPLPPRPYQQPQLSPDGTRLAVQTTYANGESNIWVYDLDGNTQMRQMTGEGNCHHPIWTPGGERLTFTSDRDGQQRIYWQPADLSSVAEPLTPPEAGVLHYPDSWTPDGRTLSFTKRSGGLPRSVWTLSVDEDDEGGQPELFVTTAEGPGSLGSAFSRDGQWLVYSKGTLLDGGLYLQPFPATGTEFQLTQEGGSYPIWSRDGRQLFYSLGSTGTGGLEGLRQAGEFVAIDINLEGTPAWTNERTLPIEGFLDFEFSRDYDITPNGERFIMVFPVDETESGEPARPQINVVQNWFEELRERVPVP
jgi:eukaryotic-like serine/threonine-protein kinase